MSVVSTYGGGRFSLGYFIGRLLQANVLLVREPAAIVDQLHTSLGLALRARGGLVNAAPAVYVDKSEVC
jgi:hypothetical protein